MSRQDNYQTTLWTWTDQGKTRDSWPAITNRSGTRIPITPRRYAISLVSDRQDLEMDYLVDMSYNNLHEAVRTNHSYRLAPEPLHTLTSVFQLLHSSSARCLFLYLTNISSQHIRRSLVEEVLAIMARDHLRPTTTWIQICNETYPTIPFRSRTAEEVLTAIKTAQTKLGMIRIPENETIPP
jgi:hypothetical protein